MTARARRAAVGLALLAAAITPVVTGTVARSADERLDADRPSTSWSGGPLTGTTAVVRRITCREGITCEDHRLEVATPAAAALAGRVPVLELALHADPEGSLVLAVYEPGVEPGPTVTNSTTLGSGGAIRAPKAGTWTIRVACEVCVQSTYTVTAVLAFDAPDLPAPGFRNQTLPGSVATDGEGGAEPGIEIGPAGEVWVNAPSAEPLFWGSYDGGGSFTLHEPDTTFPTGDAWLTIGAGGEIYADNLGFVGNLLYVSRDHGETWTNIDLGATRLPFLVGVDSDRQWLTADPKVPGTVYFESHDLADPGILVAKSTDYGQTWLPLAVVSLQEVLGRGAADSAGGNFTGPVRIGPDGTMVFLIGCDTLVGGLTADPRNPEFPITKIMAAISKDGGSTWSFTTVVDKRGSAMLDHGGLPVAFDRAGNIYVAWSERALDHADTYVQMSVSRDSGATWSTPATVSGTTGSHVFPALAAGGTPGRVDVAWLESPAADFNDTMARWHLMVAQTDEGLARAPAFTTAMASDGIVHAGGICMAGTFCDVFGGNRNLLDYIWLEVDHNGMAWVAYASDIGNRTRTIVAHQVTGTGTTAPVLGAPEQVARPVVQGATAKRPALPATGGSPVPAVLGLVFAVAALVMRRASASRARGTV